MRPVPVATFSVVREKQIVPFWKDAILQFIIIVGLPIALLAL